MKMKNFLSLLLVPLCTTLFLTSCTENKPQTSADMARAVIEPTQEDIIKPLSIFTLF